MRGRSRWPWVPAVVMVRWAWRTARPARAADSPTAEALTRAKDMLAEVMAQQWKQEAALRSLNDPDPIPVRWRTPERTALMDHAANIETSHHPQQTPARSGRRAGERGQARHRAAVRPLAGGVGLGEETEAPGEAVVVAAGARSAWRGRSAAGRSTRAQPQNTRGHVRNESHQSLQPRSSPTISRRSKFRTRREMLDMDLGRSVRAGAPKSRRPDSRDTGDQRRC
jgi:nitroreductase